MALIVEDGTGKADANSYASLDDANGYHSLRGHTAWTGADEVKEAALVRATSYIDGQYGARWPGYRASGAQALDWPRDEAYDRDGHLQDEVPTAVIVATIEAALIELSTAGALTEAQERGGAIVREKVGPIETEYSDVAPAQTTYPSIKLALSRLIPFGGSMKVRRG